MSLDPKTDYHTDEDKLRACASNESCLSGEAYKKTNGEIRNISRMTLGHTLMLPLVVMLAHDPEKAEAAAQAHVALTHYSKQVLYSRKTQNSPQNVAIINLPMVS